MELAPIALFTYNRPYHTKKTLEALSKNKLAEESDLWIFSDAPKSSKDEDLVQQVRDVLNPTGFKSVHVVKREINMGLAASVIAGSSELLNKYGKVISLEDDLVTSPFFLSFMNEGLEFYENQEEIFSLSGFSFSREFMRINRPDDSDVYAHYRPMSWSWATWKNRWDKVDWEVADYESFMKDKAKQKAFELGGRDLTTMLRNQMEGRVDSWYIRWSYACFKQSLLNIYPRYSLVNNIGHDGTGVHKSNEVRDVFSHQDLLLSKDWKFVTNPVVDKNLVSRFNEAFRPSFMTKLKRKLLIER